jgi:hypothetical protein
MVNFYAIGQYMSLTLTKKTRKVTSYRNTFELGDCLLGERHGSAAERLIAGSRQTLVKDQQQQQVMATVMSSMMNSMIAPQAVTGYQRSTNMALPPSYDTNVTAMQPNVMSGIIYYVLNQPKFGGTIK